VALVWDRKFLGYSFWMTQDMTVHCRVAPKALEDMKRRVREITCRTRGRNLTQVCDELGTYLRGWKEYFRLAETPRQFRGLDGWIHRRLRVLQLKHWKRGYTTHREMLKRGLPERLARKGAAVAGRWWWAAALHATHRALPGKYFERLGVPRLATHTSTC
jgi:hypothetical protein